jgi:putative DNA-invertase from lambdoid prophage Rac
VRENIQRSLGRHHPPIDPGILGREKLADLCGSQVVAKEHSAKEWVDHFLIHAYELADQHPYLMSHPMHRIAYYRVSTSDQSIEAQRHALGGDFDQEFKDEGVSGGVMAADRPGFADMLAKVREGDVIHVYAVDRLGRDALDVQATVRFLIDRGVTVDVRGIGPIGRGVGELILAVLAQVADLERQRIAERTRAGREAARAALEATGRTHRGATSLGRPRALSGPEIAAWRRANGNAPHGASIAETARHFGVSHATVKRYCADAKASG